MSDVFLKAEWRKLILANYIVDEALLKPYVPKGTQLDLWEGRCYVSLVGFMFMNTTVKGITVPMHTNFEEVNLRFYLKRITPQGEIRRGVAFIKELVPKSAITWVANALYHEHYETVEMKHHWKGEGELKVQYKWMYAGHWQNLEVTADQVPQPFAEGSEAEFITEHYWGYTAYSAEETTEYAVEHPSWEIYPVKDHAIDVDFEANYGTDFKLLNETDLASVMLAEGSEILVKEKRSIHGT